MKNKLASIFNPELSNFSLDARSLSLFRIALGLVVLFDIMTFLPHIDIFYSNEGILPTYSYRYRHWYDASLHALSGARAAQIILFAIHGIAAIALTLGIFTRPAVIINLVLLLSVHHRIPAVLNGGDHLLGLLLFWSIFLPLDADFTLFKKKNAVQKIPKQVLGLPTFAFCLQLALVYLMTILLKNNQAWIYEASALFYSLNLNELIRPIWAGSFSEFSVMMKVGSIFTMILELFLGVAIIWPWRNATLRYWLIGSGFLLHAGIFVIMDIGPFPLVDIAAFIAFIPSQFWDKFRSYPEVSEATEVAPGPLWKGLRIARNAFLVLCIASVLSSNAKPFVNRVDPITNKMCSVFDLYQNWNMFSDPSKVQKWINIVGIDKESTKVTVNFPGAYNSDLPPPNGTQMYSSPRLQKYIDNITNKNFANHRNELLKWLCSKGTYENSQLALDSVSIIVYRQHNDPYARAHLIESDTLASCRCEAPVNLSAAVLDD